MEKESVRQDDRWYALQVRPRFEKVISKNLQSKGYEEFLPLYKRQSRWSDRTKEIQLPLFPGYVFSKFDVNQRLGILMIPGVISLVGIGKTPIPVDEAEIQNIRTLTQSGVYCEPLAQLAVGQQVEVGSGPLAGMRGYGDDGEKQLSIRHLHHIPTSLCRR